MCRLVSALALCLTAATASAAPMQLNHQGRLLDAGGAPVSGTHTLVFNIRDGATASQFTETFAGVNVASGYYGVTLGAGATVLDTSVFLTHGAMDLQISVDGVPTGASPLGGYPVVVAQQSLLSLEATSQQILAALPSAPSFSQTCTDFAAKGWATEADCLHDGRWHMVFDQGAGVGLATTVITYVTEGASVRVTTAVNPAAFDCVSISIDNRVWGAGTANAVCHSAPTSHPGPLNVTNGTTYWSTYDLSTSGALTYTERQGTAGLLSGLWNANAQGKWYVRF